AKLSIQATLESLREAGLDSMPGGGAEIFDDEVRNTITAKMDAKTWLDIHRTAHNVGLKSNATMLYGHVEKSEHRLDHMFKLRDLQDITHGFNAFIPLAFQPHDNDMGIDHYTLGTMDLRTLAIARLILDNFKYIKAYWVMLGQDIAQLAVLFGANDLDGTVREEKIARAAGGRSGHFVSQDMLHTMIAKTGKIPTQRDSVYSLFSERSPSEIIAPRANTTPASDDLLTTLKNMVPGSDEQLTTMAQALQKEPLLAESLLLPEFWWQTLALSQKKVSHFHGPRRRLITTRLFHDGENHAHPDMLITNLTRMTAGQFKDFLAQIGSREQDENSLPMGLIGGEKLQDFCSNYREITQTVHSLYENGVRIISVASLNLDCLCALMASPIQVRVQVSCDGGKSFQPNLSCYFHDLCQVQTCWIATKHLPGSLTLEVIPRDKSWWVPSEFIHLLALTRLIVDCDQISVPILDVPVLNPHSHKGGHKQYPEDKILGLLAAFSCSDLGLIPHDDIDKQSVAMILAGESLHLSTV
ncbi:MAG: hypothetical protein OXC40_05625, partial [Proteobacteria bacterium]|nr:hypothetical protein [Pseudomonadota bacterium]